MNKLSKFMFVAALTALSPLTSMADIPGQHPGYLHAISDLRNARGFLTHQPGDKQVYEGEDVSIVEINHALDEIKRIATEDGKNIKDEVPVDAHEAGSRLAKAIEALKKALKDISLEEDNPMAREARGKAKQHIEAAIKAAEKAHSAFVKEQKH